MNASYAVSESNIGMAASLRRSPQFAEPVENEIETELERAHLAVRPLGEVLVAMLEQVGYSSSGSSRATRSTTSGGATPCVEHVVGGVGRVGGEPRLAQPAEEGVHVRKPQIAASHPPSAAGDSISAVGSVR
jgi:hypothetical protein